MVQLQRLALPEMIPPALDRRLSRTLAPWTPTLRPLLADRLHHITQKDRKGRTYAELCAHLPDVGPTTVDLDRDWIRIGRPEDLKPAQRAVIENGLRELIPWRKGPFDIFGILVDSEWASYMKWNRITPFLSPLTDRRVLDIGSSSGYYMLRMLAAEPALVVGVEPYPTFYFQFLLLQRYLRAARLVTFPLRFEALPDMGGFFDTVFCMGIIYHQRDPESVLRRVARMLRCGGELVLETLIIEGAGDGLLELRGRYAKMANVYALPTIRRIESWLGRSGFGHIRCVDVTPTTPQEQRRTQWMPFESLRDYIDSNDPRRTVEGHPAPVRALILAQKQ